MFRIFLAQQRSAPDVAIVDRAPAALDRRARARRRGAPGAVRDVLDRLVLATQLRFPARRRPRPQRPLPLVRPAAGRRRARRACWPASRDEVAALAADPDAPDRTRRIDALAAIPEQIVRLPRRAARGRRPGARADARGADPPPLPRVRPARPALVRASTVGRSPCADYVLDDRPTRLVSTVGHRRRARDPDSALVTAVGRRRSPPARPVSEARRRPLPRLAGRARSRRRARQRRARPRVLAPLPFAHDVRRVAVGVCPGGGRPVAYFTFRPAPTAALVEDDLVRGVHPMVGRRLDLWRLRDFDITRARRARGRAALPLRRPGQRGRPAARRPGPGASARRRPRRGRAGSPSLPHVERAIANCLEAIRRARAARGARRRAGST